MWTLEKLVHVAQTCGSDLLKAFLKSTFVQIELIAPTWTYRKAQERYIELSAVQYAFKHPDKDPQETYTARKRELTDLAVFISTRPSSSRVRVNPSGSPSQRGTDD
jgi:hypothetical protein